MNSIVKGDVTERKVVAKWSAPGVYTTEAQFIPRPGATEEEDGVLFTVLYDSNIDKSVVALLNPRALTLIGNVTLDFVIPYHSHGVSCNPKGKCFTNP
jgi:torulene dioxygenase